MSTKAIRIALDWLHKIGTREDELFAKDALAEVEAIEKAAGELDKAMRASDEVGAPSWEGFAAARDLMAAIARQEKP